MLTSGDLAELDLGEPIGREAGFSRPVVIVTAQRVLDSDPSVVHAVPLASQERGFRSEVLISPDETNRLNRRSSAQCQNIRAVSVERVQRVSGNVGPAVLAEIREVVGLILDIP